jgi:hypothetical protein
MEQQNNSVVKSRAGLYAVIIAVGILLLAYVDYITLEKIYHPIAAKYSINWNEFNAVVFGKQTAILQWQFAFMPLGVVMFILLGLAARSCKLAVCGILLFATGWEDIFYYLIQGKWLPAELGWLDYSPIMGFTRILTSTPHVTSTGVIISSAIGLIVSCLILFPVSFRNWKKVNSK